MSTPFPDAYELYQQEVLGLGGCSDGIERWVCRLTNKHYAVKILSSATVAASPGLVFDELRGFGLTHSTGVPRTVRLHEHRRSPAGDEYFIMELLQGGTLEQVSALWACGQTQQGQREALVTEVAAQLFDTLEYMHERAGLAHMDICNSNIYMHCGGASRELKLLDFGLSKIVVPGRHGLLLYPEGFKHPFAPPELLCTRAQRQRSARIDIKALDIWSSGVVLFQLLHNTLPFTPQDSSGRVLQAPVYLSEQGSLQWDCNETWQLQKSWADAVESAEKSGQPINHCVADQIRTSSTVPDQALDFFASLLHPDTTKRSTAGQAANHPYLRHAMSQIDRAWCSTSALLLPNYPAPSFQDFPAATAAADADSNGDAEVYVDWGVSSGINSAPPSEQLTSATDGHTTMHHISDNSAAGNLSPAQSAKSPFEALLLFDSFASALGAGQAATGAQSSSQTVAQTGNQLSPAQPARPSREGPFLSDSFTSGNGAEYHVSTAPEKPKMEGHGIDDAVRQAADVLVKQKRFGLKRLSGKLIGLGKGLGRALQKTTHGPSSSVGERDDSAQQLVRGDILRVAKQKPTTPSDDVRFLNVTEHHITMQQPCTGDTVPTSQHTAAVRHAASDSTDAQHSSAPLQLLQSDDSDSKRLSFNNWNHKHEQLNHRPGTPALSVADPTPITEVAPTILKPDALQPFTSALSPPPGHKSVCPPAVQLHADCTADQLASSVSVKHAAGEDGRAAKPAATDLKHPTVDPPDADLGPTTGAAGGLRPAEASHTLPDNPTSNNSVYRGTIAKESRGRKFRRSWVIGAVAAVAVGVGIFRLK